MANLCYCSLSHSSSYDSYLMLWPPLPGPPTNVGLAVGRVTGPVVRPEPLPLETPPMRLQVAAQMLLKLVIRQ